MLKQLISLLFILIQCTFLQAQCGSALLLSGSTTEDNTTGFNEAVTCGNQNTVWFELQGNGNNLFDLDIIPGTLSNFSVEIYDACGGNIIAQSACDVSSFNLTDLCFPDPNGSIFIMVGSDPANAGTFDITGDSTPGEPNDTCDGAAPIGVNGLVCTGTYTFFTSIPPNNIPCPDASNTCDPVTPGYWLTFMADDAVTEFTVTGNLFELFEGSCGSLNSITCTSQTITADPTLNYFLWVGETTTLLPSPPPDNDLCSTATNADSGNVSDNNICASPDVPLCGAQGEASVWYSYELLGVATLDINVNEISIVNSAVAIYNSCGGTQLGADCSGSLVAACLNPGTYYIQVSSEATDAGTFDLSITESTASNPASICTDAIPISVSTTCVPEMFNGDTTDACPEATNFGSGCSFTTNPTIWFSYTPSAASTSFDLLNLSGNLELSVLDGPCGSSLAGCISNNTNVPLAGGTTYYIAATLNGAPGNFDFQIKENEAPSNDLCLNAIDATGGISGENNNCSTEDDGFCGTQGEASLWYSYTLSDALLSLEINVNAGTISNPALAIYDACGGTQLAQDCSGSLITDCLVAGVYYIQVASSSDNAGTFDIDFVETLATNPNGDCNNPLSINNSTICSAEIFIGDTSGACPEISNYGSGCSFSTNPTIWYAYTPSSAASSFDLLNLSPDLELSVFDGPCGNVLATCITFDTNVPLPGGTTYYIAATLISGPGSLNFEIIENQSPINDLCVNAIDATGGISGEDNNCSTQDDGFCGSQGEASLWYSYTLASAVSSLEINVTSGSINNPAVAIYNACGGSPIIEDCTGSIVTGCLGSGVYFIQVASSANDAGTFDIDFTETLTTNPNSDCNAPNAIVISTGCISELFSGDTSGACPETSDYGSGCSFEINPTVWYSYTPSAAATSFDILNLSADLELNILDGPCGNSLAPCIDTDNNVPFSGGTTYYIAATVISAPGTFSFEIIENRPPPNDLCNNAIDATNGISDEDNTCSTTDDGFCGSQGEASLWYSYTLSNAVESLEITVMAGTIVNPAVAMYDACGGSQLAEGCSGTITTDCLSPGTYYIQVASSANEAGTFDLNFMENLPSNPISDCNNALPISTSLSCTSEEFSGSTAGACPESTMVNGGCNFQTNSTVWYALTLFDNTSSVDFVNLSPNLELAVFDAPCGNAVTGCITSDFNLSGITQMTYYIAASLTNGENFSFEVIENSDGPDLILEVNDCIGSTFVLTGYNLEFEDIEYELYYDANFDFSFDGTTILGAEFISSSFGQEINYAAQQSGTYILLGITDGGCINFTTIEIDELPTAIFSLNQQAPFCQGDLITINLDNPNEFDDFTWSTGSNENSIEVSPTDTVSYILELETSSGCIIIDSIVLNISPLPVAEIFGSSSFCAGETAPLEVSGPPSNTYQWVGPSGEIINTQIAEIDIEGQWIATVINDQGCSASDTVFVTEETSILLSLVDESICDSGTVTLDGGSGFDNYNWLDPSGQSIGSDQTVDVSTPGEYTLNIELGNCPGSGTVNVEIINSLPAAVTANAESLCNSVDGALDYFIDLTMFETGVSGSWFNENGILVQNPSNVEFLDVTPSVLQYSFLTDEAIFPCVNDEYFFEITILDCTCPNYQVESLSDICTEQNIIELETLQGNAEPGEWSVEPAFININGDNEIIIDENTTPGSYTLTYTLLGTVPTGCPGESSISFEVVESPMADIEMLASVCNEDPMDTDSDLIDLDDLNITGALGQWSNTEGFAIDNDNVVSFAGAVTGDYTFNFLMPDTTGLCSSASYDVTITVMDCSCPEINLEDPPFLCDNIASYDLDDLIISAAPGTWISNSIPPIEITQESTISLTDLSGVYSFTYALDNPIMDCPEEQNIEINIETISTSGIGTTETYCAETSETISLSEILVDEDLGGIWIDVIGTGQAFNETGGTVDLTNLEVGIYEFIYEINSINTCPSASTSVFIEIVENPIADAGDDGVIGCNDAAINLGGLGSSMGNNITYSWMELGGAEIFNNDELNVSVSVAGIYELMVTDQSTGCFSTDQSTITLEENVPSFFIEIEQPCQGDDDGAIVISDVTGGNGTIIFSLDSGVNWSDENRIENLTPGNYTIIAEDEDGCRSTQENIIINALPSFDVDAGEDMNQLSEDQMVTIGFSTTLDPSQINLITWTEDGIDICESDTEMCQAVEVNPEGNTEYCVTIIDVNGCSQSDCIQLSESENRDIYVPNIFSPNDPANNIFKIFSGSVETTVEEFKIYDRWGELIFDINSSYDPNQVEIGWDGKFKGSNAMPGVYIYMITITHMDGTREILTGSVTVI